MKKAVILFCILVAAGFASAEVAVEDITLAESSALDNYDPTLEIDKEMESESSMEKKADSSIPTQPAVEVIAEPLDFINPDGSTVDSNPGQFKDYPLEPTTSSTRIDPSEFKQKKGGWYISGLYGTTEYDQPNMSSDNAIGFSVGNRFSEYFILEASLMFSELYSDFPQFAEEIQQYNVMFDLKVPLFEGQIFAGRLQPAVAVSSSYTRRNYKAFGYNGFIVDRDERPTNAFDMGFGLGVDFAVSKKFSLGVNYRYMFKVAGGGDSEFETNGIQVFRADPVEDINYQMMSFGAKFNF